MYKSSLFFSYAPASIGRGQKKMACPFVRLSVCLSAKSFILAIAFERSVRELLYFTYIFLGAKPCLWYQSQDHLPRSRSTKKLPFRGHSCFTNTCCFWTWFQQKVCDVCKVQYFCMLSKFNLNNYFKDEKKYIWFQFLFL